MAQNSYLVVTSSKLAAALAAVGVPLVSPKITRSKFLKGGSAKVRVAFYFGLTTLDGETSTIDLIKAWHKPEKYVEKSEPLCLMGAFRAALENKEKLVDVAHKFLRSQDRGDLDEFELTLIEAANHENVPTFSLVPKGKVHILVGKHASKEERKKLVKIADIVSTRL